LFNGADGEWQAEIVQTGKRGVSLTVGPRMRAQSEESADLWLLFAPVKRLKLDLIVEKATELGASRLVPVLTRHTIADHVNARRLSAIAIEAAEQCERLSIPILEPPQPLDDALADWPRKRTLLVLTERGGAPIAKVLAELEPGAVAVLAGPEGGFAKSELDALDSMSFAVAASLGPRILRAETAIIAALSCAQAWCGDWGNRQPSVR
jgi:16S rRNA (uracil1498-N3)-methyltransferase